MSEPLYLQPNVVAEPLVEQWYAWPHLISPATAAMCVLDHLQIMDSYIKAAHIHAAAVKDPKLFGGPFMDFPTNRVEEVRSLRDRTRVDQAAQIELARAIKDLDRLLAESARGYSLEPLYERLPPPVRGYVELVYDLNNHPSFRFYESLLYRSRYFNRGLQSVALSRVERDFRPFMLSTPKLDTSGSVVHLRLPFASPALDDLFRMKQVPGSYEVICDRLGRPIPDEELFRSFFTAEQPTPCHDYQGDGVRVRYFGHACILVETREVSILSDPMISYAHDTELGRFTYAELPEVIDEVILTHNHQDHVSLESLLQLRHKVRRVIVPRQGSNSLQDPSLRLMLREIGFDNIIELGEMETVRLDGCTVTGIPFLGEHGDLNISSKLCYHIVSDRFAALFLADSCNIEPAVYQHVHELVGDVDVLFLGMECEGAPVSWLYGHLFTQRLGRDMDGTRRLSGSNSARGMDLVERFHPQDVFVYAMGQEPWLEYICNKRYTDTSIPIVESNTLLAECHRRGLRAERLFGERELHYVRSGQRRTPSMP